MNKIEQIKELIAKDGLLTKSRNRDIVDRRSYLYYKLKEEGYSLTNIGKLFDKNHATIINGIKKHEFYTMHNDYSYSRNIKHYIELLDDSYIKPRSLKDDILRCTNTTELKLIQERIIMGKYN